MYSITNLKKDTLIQLDGVPYRVVDYQHTQLGRGGAVVKTKLKNLLDSSLVSKTFKGNDKVEPARLDKADMQYLYADGSNLQFMDTKTYDQFAVDGSTLGGKGRYLVEGQPAVVLVFEGRVVDIELPNKVKLKIKQTEPGVKGDTATAALKPAILESGLKIQVPLFIKTGDTVEVDSRNGKYLNRA